MKFKFICCVLLVIASLSFLTLRVLRGSACAGIGTSTVELTESGGHGQATKEEALTVAKKSDMHVDSVYQLPDGTWGASGGACVNR